MDKIQKPISMIKNELSQSIVEKINESNLPLFVVEYILKDILNEVHVISQKQLENDIESYNNKIKKSEKESNSENQ